VERFVTSIGAKNFFIDTNDRSVKMDPLIRIRKNGCKADCSDIYESIRKKVWSKLAWFEHGNRFDMEQRKELYIYLRSTDHQARNLQELQSELAWYTIVIDIYSSKTNGTQVTYVPAWFSGTVDDDMICTVTDISPSSL
jgi:hypothetical protein